MNIEFKVRKGARTSATKAQVYGERLLQLTEQAAAEDRLLSPHEVVEDARSPESPLHSHFEWDDSIAAESHRCWQARQLIRDIVFIIDENDRPKQEINALFHVEIPNADGSKREGYVSYEQVSNSESLRWQVITKARGELLDWRNRYDALRKAFSDVFAAIDSLPLDS